MEIKFIIRCFTFLYVFLPGLISYSQDIIILKSGDEIQSKVLEITTDIIKYKKGTNLDGPLYTVNKIDVFMIKYQNGTKDVFKNTEPPAKINNDDNTAIIVELGKTFMENQILTESGGVCKLIEFEKQNGIEHDIFGQKTYTLEYRLVIELDRDIWKKSADKALSGDWYWGNFHVLFKKGDQYEAAFTNNFNFFYRDTKVEITGDIIYEKTDNGWRMTGNNMFSNGYSNKTAKILPTYYQPVKKESNSPKLPEEKIEKKITKNNLEDGLKFLAENSKKPGIITLPSGLQYQIIKAGIGQKPTLSKTVTINYIGTLINGTEFNNTIKSGKPISLPISSLMKGWQEALQLMQEGSKWKLFIPSDLAYGEKSIGTLIEPFSTVIFELELVKIESK